MNVNIPQEQGPQEQGRHKNVLGQADPGSMGIVSHKLPFLEKTNRIEWNSWSSVYGKVTNLSPRTKARFVNRRHVPSESQVIAESETETESILSLPLGGWPKRLLDLAITASALLVIWPLMLTIALMIKISSGGPVFFAHERVGFNGSTFRCYKFRTMVTNAQDVLTSHLANDPLARAEWTAHQKLKNDPRVTFLGHILRKSSIDELPQLFNIFCGDMSCVGPRPVTSSELLTRYGSSREHYLRTRPGLTGLWQVKGRNSLAYSSRVKLDTQYVQTWSIRRDFLILIATIGAVMKFDQAH